MKLLGISCYYHDSAACLIDEGRIVAAAQEERFTRIKHDSAFPVNAVRYCLAQGSEGSQGSQGSQGGHAGNGGGAVRIDGVVFYDKPLLKFHRILETYLAVAPRGLRSYVQALPLWLREKLWIPPRIEEALAACGAGAAAAGNGRSEP
ncbi:MAG TPA: carbamoyltransferase N-terminal domain-containing protein, partial [Caulobacteraceae bacterium]|nr:carbamoyltransferase N-terminal domain-containing protein [Caulobacteraceae bacterium]